MSIKKILAASMTAGIMLSFIPMTSLAAGTGWYRSINGTWQYYDVNEGYARGWKKIDGKMYYFHTEWADMLSGVTDFLIDGKYYDFASSGECLNPEGREAGSLTGWQKWYPSGTGFDANMKYYWRYYESEGVYAKNKQIVSNGKTYAVDKDGIMITGQMYQGCYFDNNGVMHESSGWFSDGENWMYAKEGGKLITDDWLLSGGKWYYFDYMGKMYSDMINVSINGIEYSFDSNGVCLNPDAKPIEKHASGWYQKTDNNRNKYWVYYDENGSVYENCWKKIDGNWYYFQSDTGFMYKGMRYVDGANYFFGESGAMVTGWHKSKYGYKGNIYWRYSGSNGAEYCNKWLQSGGKWYYFNGDGNMVSNVENYTINGIDYSFDASGACKNPYAQADTKITGWYQRTTTIYTEYQRTPYWYYYDANGVMYTNKWLQSGSNWYYFDGSGKMVSASEGVWINGLVYDFDINGACMNPYNGRTQTWS